MDKLNEIEASMKDVAKLAGESPARVSYTINNKCNVKKEIQNKVKVTINALNFRVDLTTCKPRNGKYKTVDFLVYNLANYFYYVIGNFIETVLS